MLPVKNTKIPKPFYVVEFRIDNFPVTYAIYKSFEMAEDYLMVWVLLSPNYSGIISDDSYFDDNLRMIVKNTSVPMTQQLLIDTKKEIDDWFKENLYKPHTLPNPQEDSNGEIIT